MKHVFLIFILLLLNITNLSGQVGIGTTTPDPSSILELQSSNSGFLLPRINLTGVNDITTIPAPANGLMIYNLTNFCEMQEGVYIFNGTNWKRILTSSVTHNRLIRNKIGFANVTINEINSMNTFGGFNTLFDISDNTGGGSFHQNRVGTPAGDWGFGINLPNAYNVTSLILNGRNNNCCTDRIENVVIRLYLCGTLVYSSPAIAAPANAGDNVVNIPNIRANEIRLIVPLGGDTGGGEGIINFSELDVIGSD